LAQVCIRGLRCPRTSPEVSSSVDLAVEMDGVVAVVFLRANKTTAKLMEAISSSLNNIKNYFTSMKKNSKVPRAESQK
jgi:hypothetical protein